MSAVWHLLFGITLIQFSLCKKTHRSGFYIDNGMDQTVPHQFTSRREREALAGTILQLFDIPKKSVGFRNRTLQTDTPASRFIRDVYSCSLAKREDALFKFNDADLRTIEDSDVILSYSAIFSHEHRRKNTLVFDVSEIPKYSDVFRSELRVYVKPAIRSSWKITLLDSQGFVDSIIVTKEGWVKFNTGRVLRRWLSCNDCNRELYLENDADNSDILIHDEPQKQAFLVGYFVNVDHSSVHTVVPSVRSQRSPARKLSRNFLENPYSGVHESKNRRRTSCAIHSFHVRFRELDFDRYIVEPEGFDARYCHGDCRFPLTAHMNATNHALVQTLVHFIQPSLVPRVSCAPRDYKDLPVFYSRDGRNFAYKIYRRMIVKSCGCC